MFRKPWYYWAFPLLNTLKNDILRYFRVIEYWKNYHMHVQESLFSNAFKAFLGRFFVCSLCKNQQKINRHLFFHNFYLYVSHIILSRYIRNTSGNTNDTNGSWTFLCSCSDGACRNMVGTWSEEMPPRGIIGFVVCTGVHAQVAQNRKN